MREFARRMVNIDRRIIFLLIALATLDVPAYPADALPPELAALPVEDPGSRRLAK